MTFASWLRDSFGGPRTLRRRPTRRLKVEQLEDRTVPALVFGEAFTFGGTAIAPDVGAAIAVDDHGNQYVEGSFYDTIDMDPGPGEVLLTSASATKSDLFVAKYGPAGDLLWANRMGGPESDTYSGYGDLTVDGAGNVFVTGMLRSTADFGSFTLTSQGLSDIFIAKLDENGNFDWVTRFGKSNDTVNLNEEGFGIAADALGNVYTTGKIYNSVFESQIFVAKHDTNGNLVWLKNLGESRDGGGGGNDLAMDAAGNICVTGSFVGRVDFDPGPNTYMLSVPNPTTSYSDGFVLKLDANGNFVWAGRMGGDNNDSGNGIAVDDMGQVYVVGDFYSTNFALSPAQPNLVSAGSSDVFVVKFGANSDLLWAESMGGPAAELGRSIGVDGSGDVYVTGSFGDTVDFDPGAASFNLTSVGITDVVVSRLDRVGNFVWAGQLAGPGMMWTNDLGLDGAGNVYLAGTFTGSTDFDPGPGEYLLNSKLDSTGIARSDAFVVKLNQTDAPPPPPAPSLSIHDVSVSEGNSGTTTVIFTVTRSGDTAQEVTVAYATANGTATAGSDYEAADGTLIFAPGETSQTITVLVNGDRAGEANETFSVNLSGATNATIADGQGVGTILDDEPRISISDVTKREGKKGQTTLFTFTVTLSAAYDQAVTMSFRTVDGTATTGDGDYIAKSGTLTFAPGETTKTITIEVKGDSKKEANETFYLDLFDLSSNALFTKNRGVGTILNDD
jgi:Calx-beta domain